MNKLWLIGIALFIWSCEGQPQKKDLTKILTKKERFEISQNSLKQVLEKEQSQIKKFIQRKGGSFTESQTGVHYFIYSKENNQKYPVAGNRLSVQYGLKLLNGVEIKAKNTTDQITLDYDDKESGLHEILKKMQLKEKAIIIIPSHRAHGLVGNDQDIPPVSSLVYDIQLLSIE